MSHLGHLSESSPFRGEPYIIVPLTDDERRFGKATLLTNADLDVLVRAMKAAGEDEHAPLYEKLLDLRMP